MNVLAEIWRRILFLFRRERATLELEEEMHLHLQLRAARLRAQGLDPDEAWFAARRRFGNVINLQERSRDMWGLDWMEHAAADFRFAVRRLRRRPGFAFATISVVALGIGATTAVFSAVDAALFRALPFPDASALVTLTSVNIPFDPGPNQMRRGTSRHIFDINDATAMRDVFTHVAAYAAGGLNLSDDHPRRVNAGVVTAGFFATLGVAAAKGRVFSADEGKPNSGRPVVISDALWRSQFGSGDVIGKTLDLSGGRYTVIGVMPAGFSFPNESDLWIPLTVPTTFETFSAFRGWLPSRVIARMAPGVTTEVASAKVVTGWEQLREPTPGKRSNLDEMIDNVKKRGGALALQRELVGDRRKALLVLMGATALLLLIACANVANLLLSDALSRRREVALREVLGASRSRIVRQLLAESVVLAFVGAAIGVLVAPATLKLLSAMMPAALAGVATPHVDLRVLAFATTLALITGIGFGLWPASGTSRLDATETIKSGGGHGSTAGGVGAARRVLIVGELALTVMLLVGAGLMLRSLHRLMTQDSGMNPDRVATLEVSLPRGMKAHERVRLANDVVARLAADPAIDAVGAVNDLPLRGGGGIGLSVQVDGAPRPKDPDMAFSRMLSASPGYFRALGIPLVLGTTFPAVYDSAAPPVAVISETMAKVWWPNTNPIGKTFRTAGDSVPFTVIGVAADVREAGLDRDPEPQMYFSVDAWSPQNLAIVARSRLEPGDILSRLTSAVRAVAPRQAVYNVKMMDQVISKSVAPRRTNTVLIGIFGAVALILSAFGVYAVVSQSVTRRQRELGIRAALGASSGDIVGLVTREMGALVALGVVLGLGGAWVLSRVLGTLLYQIGTHDLGTFLVAPAALVVPAAIATLLPARRATRVSPTEVMRVE